jgi:hypothetical protein
MQPKTAADPIFVDREYFQAVQRQWIPVRQNAGFLASVFFQDALGSCWQ